MPSAAHTVRAHHGPSYGIPSPIPIEEWTSEHWQIYDTIELIAGRLYIPTPEEVEEARRIQGIEQKMQAGEDWLGDLLAMIGEKAEEAEEDGEAGGKAEGPGEAEGPRMDWGLFGESGGEG